MTEMSVLVRSDLTKLRRTKKVLPIYADDVAKDAAQMGVEIARGLFEDSPPNKDRPIYRKGRIHYPSFPGNPPRIDTKKLWRSMKAKKLRKAQWQLLADDPKSAILEFGGNGVAPRPFMGVTATILEKEYKSQIVVGELEKKIK